MRAGELIGALVVLGLLVASALFSALVLLYALIGFTWVMQQLF